MIKIEGEDTEKALKQMAKHLATAWIKCIREVRKLEKKHRQRIAAYKAHTTMAKSKAKEATHGNK